MASAKKKKKRKNKKKKNPKKTSVFGWLFKWVFVLGAWAALFGLGLTAWYAAELPDITREAKFERKTNIIIKAADGSVIDRYGEISGDRITVDRVPDHLLKAVMAVEDRRFYLHFGLDPIGLTRAMVVNMREGRIVQGGSTVTQQLAKNLFLSRERTIKRKIQEAVLALWLEAELTKDEIMSAYLNRVYLGAGTYGVEAAANHYFGKPASQLDLRESALIAGLLKAPSRFSPTANPALARQRTEVVLAAMVDAGYISENQAKAPFTGPPRPAPKPVAAKATRYFTDWVVDGLDDLIGTPQEDIIVETTLIPSVQEEAGKSLSELIARHGEEHRLTQGAILSLRSDGAVIAMVGGANYRESQFNRAVQARRQPGSAFKPFLYLAAIEQGWHPRNRILDEPFGPDSEYRPANFKDEYFGDVTLEEALTRSLNTAAVRLIMETGHEHVRGVARRLGIISPLGPDLSLALGTSGVSMLELTTAYAALANEGLAVYPYAITRITDADGTLYYERNMRRPTRQVVEKRDVRTLRQMMQSVVENGTGRGAAIEGVEIAGKTGTSQDSRDAWFIGFTDNVTTGVWLGNDDNTPMRLVTGGSFPPRIWRRVTLAAEENANRFSFVRLQGPSEFRAMLQNILQGTAPEQRLYETQIRRQTESFESYNLNN